MMKSVIASALALVAISQPLFAAENIADLEKAARGEGQLQSVGMPDSWANWKDTWQQLGSIYGIKHQDTDMSSAQEIAKFAAEKANATADIGDVGGAFGPVAVKQGVTQPYKPSTWNDIPDWAKDKDGHWVLAYTGTISFMINKSLVKDEPKSWADLLKGKYKVTIGDVSFDFVPTLPAGTLSVEETAGLGGRGTDARIDAPHRVRAAERLAAKKARRVPYELTETWSDDDLPEDDA